MSHSSMGFMYAFAMAVVFVVTFRRQNAAEHSALIQSFRFFFYRLLFAFICLYTRIAMLCTL